LAVHSREPPTLIGEYPMPSRIPIAAFFYCLLFFVSTATNAVAQTPAPAGGFALLIGVDKYAQPPPTSLPISDLRGPATMWR
jgi:uncharacterized membrane protein YhhN